MSKAAEVGPHRPELLKALELLAQVSEAMHRRGLPRPVLVGGAAAEYFSASAVMTGDVDLTSPVQAELEEELVRLGFTKPEGLGHTPLGWVHPELGLGFEVVASTPMDGTVDYRRILLVEGVGEGGPFAVIPIEDLIADRMGQFASGSAPEMLEQARLLLQFNPGLDLAYLDAFERKRWATMDSKTSADWPGRVLSHQDYAAALAERRAALGNPDMPRNSGNRRTESKRALLKAIEDAGGRW